MAVMTDPGVCGMTALGFGAGHFFGEQRQGRLTPPLDRSENIHEWIKRPEWTKVLLNASSFFFFLFLSATYLPSVVRLRPWVNIKSGSVIFFFLVFSVVSMWGTRKNDDGRMSDAIALLILAACFIMILLRSARLLGRFANTLLYIL